LNFRRGWSDRNSALNQVRRADRFVFELTAKVASFNDNRMPLCTLPSVLAARNWHMRRFWQTAEKSCHCRWCRRPRHRSVAMAVTKNRDGHRGPAFKPCLSPRDISDPSSNIARDAHNSGIPPSHLQMQFPASWDQENPSTYSRQSSYARMALCS
jgi:hypothetical protein